MSQVLGEGNISKMKTELLDGVVHYQLPFQNNNETQLVLMNDLIGQSLTLEYNGVINCVHCDRLSKKSFNQGYCYPCFKKLAQCDQCIMSPEKCHFHEGTCREPEWGEANCFIDHYVYLANSSGLKVGITRGTQIPTRWMDQGAVQALPILKVSTRQLSGLCEVVFKEHTNDKTNWRKMLKNEVDVLNLPEERDRLFELADAQLAQLEQEHGLQAIQRLGDADALAIDYPVIEYPTKVSSHNLDKTATVSGKLMGIKGQYLIFDSGVINMRKFSGYKLQLLTS